MLNLLDYARKIEVLLTKDSTKRLFVEILLQITKYASKTEWPNTKNRTAGNSVQIRYF